MGDRRKDTIFFRFLQTKIAVLSVHVQGFYMNLKQRLIPVFLQTGKVCVYVWMVLCKLAHSIQGQLCGHLNLSVLELLKEFKRERKYYLQL